MILGYHHKTVKISLIFFLVTLPLAGWAEIATTKVNVLGQVNNQGQFTVADTRMTLLDAIALAGGLSRLADAKNIKVRKETPDGNVTIEVYNLNKIVSGEQENVRLHTGDLLYIEERIF